MTAPGRFILALVVLAAPLGAAGQVRLVQDGRALDANPYVGSGGYNSAYPTGFLDSQLIVNRQVSGLAGFRGSVAYYPVDQLSLPLPTDSLETFRRQSVGTQDVLRGQTYAPAPYYDPTRTIVGLRSIASGRAVPGSPVPQALLPAGLFGQAGTVAYTPLAVSAVTGLWDLRSRPTEGSFLRFEAGGLSAPARAAPENLFAVPDARQRQRLAEEVSQVQMPTELMVQSQVETRVDPSAAVERRRWAGLVPEDMEPNEPNAAGGIAPARQPGYAPSLTVPLAPDQDVFSELLARMQGTVGPAESAVPSPGPSAWDASQQQEGPASAAERIQARQAQLRTHPAAVGTEALLTAGGGTLVQYSPGGGLLLRGLAGTGQDEFNTTMAQAEKDLKGGKYYKAAEGYRLAASLQPDNPLPRLGLSLALFAAGEPLGAARHLRRAAVTFPPILTSGVDIAGLADAELMQRRLAFLATRLEHVPSEDPMLYFIGAYVYANLGQAAQARDYALKLQASAGTDTLLAEYARFVLTGQSTSAPASQPASAPSGQ